MRQPQDVVKLAHAYLPTGLHALRDRLKSEGGRLLEDAAKPSSVHSGEEGLESFGTEAEPELPTLSEELDKRDADQGRDFVAAVAARAADKIIAHGEGVHLTPVESDALEAIVLLTGRPAIFIQDGSFFPPPADWTQLNDHRVAIEKSIRSVGRIEVDGHPTLPWLGTGWVVAPNVLMTNRHVAKEFCRPKANGKWEIEPDMKVWIDFHEELNSAVGEEFVITDVIGIHDRFDMALLRMAEVGKDGVTPAPPPLMPLKQSPAANLSKRQVYVLGYPAWDGRRNDPDVMQRLFSGIFNIKRLLPGELISFDDAKPLLLHDCSTLGGNSGSAVIDLATHQVVGLHFSGFYGQYNQAVPLWKVQDDPLIQEAEVTFG